MTSWTNSGVLIGIWFDFGGTTNCVNRRSNIYHWISYAVRSLDVHMTGIQTIFWVVNYLLTGYISQRIVYLQRKSIFNDDRKGQEKWVSELECNRKRKSNITWLIFFPRTRSTRWNLASRFQTRTNQYMHSSNKYHIFFGSQSKFLFCAMACGSNAFRLLLKTGQSCSGRVFQ